PVLAVQIHHDSALVKPVMAFPEICLYNKAEIPFLCLYLKYRCIVIAKMIVGPLPQVCVRLCHDFYYSVMNDAAFRFSCPFEFTKIYFHLCPPLFSPCTLQCLYYISIYILTLFISQFHNP